MLMLSLRLLCLLTCVALAACSIPYKTPDAQARIEHDLNIAHGDIVSMAEPTSAHSTMARKLSVAPKSGWAF